MALTLHLNPEERWAFSAGSSIGQGGHLNSRQRSLPLPPAPAALPRLGLAASDLSRPEHPLPDLPNSSFPRTPSGPPRESKPWEDRGGHRDRGQSRLRVGMEGLGVVSKAGRLEAPQVERGPASQLPLGPLRAVLLGNAGLATQRWVGTAEISGRPWYLQGSA